MPYTRPKLSGPNIIKLANGERWALDMRNRELLRLLNAPRGAYKDSAGAHRLNWISCHYMGPDPRHDEHLRLNPELKADPGHWTYEVFDPRYVDHFQDTLLPVPFWHRVIHFDHGGHRRAELMGVEHILSRERRAVSPFSVLREAAELSKLQGHISADHFRKLDEAIKGCADTLEKQKRPQTDGPSLLKLYFSMVRERFEKSQDRHKKKYPLTDRFDEALKALEESETRLREDQGGPSRYDQDRAVGDYWLKHYGPESESGRRPLVPKGTVGSIRSRPDWPSRTEYEDALLWLNRDFNKAVVECRDLVAAGKLTEKKVSRFAELFPKVVRKFWESGGLDSGALDGSLLKRVPSEKGRPTHYGGKMLWLLWEAKRLQAQDEDNHVKTACQTVGFEYSETIRGRLKDLKKRI